MENTDMPELNILEDNATEVSAEQAEGAGENNEEVTLHIDAITSDEEEQLKKLDMAA